MLGERFFSKVSPEPNSGCWLWTAATNGKGGYGLFCVKGETKWENKYAHRVSYEHHVGPIPDGLDIDHLCRNRACVNPAHLEPVTRKVNLNRGEQAKRNKTHCPQGHPYSGDNLIISRLSDGRVRRMCRECLNADGRRRYAERGPEPYRIKSRKYYHANLEKCRATQLAAYHRRKQEA